jgi:hypothetical protein
MTAWPKDELQRFAETRELYVSPLRDDGATYAKPLPIWAVSVDGALYARGYYGQKTRWYQAALRQKTGRISAQGMTKEVAFEPAHGAINDRIDDAYRAKYGSSPFVAAMLDESHRATTLRIMPRDVR